MKTGVQRAKAESTRKLLLHAQSKIAFKTKSHVPSWNAVGFQAQRDCRVKRPQLRQFAGSLSSSTSLAWHDSTIAKVSPSTSSNTFGIYETMVLPYCSENSTLFANCQGHTVNWPCWPLHAIPQHFLLQCLENHVALLLQRGQSQSVDQYPQERAAGQVPCIGGKAGRGGVVPGGCRPHACTTEGVDCSHQHPNP